MKNLRKTLSRPDVHMLMLQYIQEDARARRSGRIVAGLISTLRMRVVSRDAGAKRIIALPYQNRIVRRRRRR